MEEETILLWKRRIKDAAESGLTIRRWCRENNISEVSFYRWKKKIRNMECPEGSSIFAEVTHLVREIPSPAPEGLRVTWNSCSFLIQSDADVRLAASLIERIREIC